MYDESTTGGGFFQIIKGVGLALVFSFLTAVVFATVLKSFPIPDKVIYPVNQTLKVLCILLGAFAFVRGEKGYLKGGAIGLLFTALSYLTFSAIGGDFSVGWLIVMELFLALFSGVVGGALAVNFRRS